MGRFGLEPEMTGDTNQLSKHLFLCRASTIILIIYIYTHRVITKKIDK